MPVSYDASSLLKCTVSMTYIRYYITNGIGDSDSLDTSPTPNGLNVKNQNPLKTHYYNNFEPTDNRQNSITDNQ